MDSHQRLTLTSSCGVFVLCVCVYVVSHYTLLQVDLVVNQREWPRLDPVLAILAVLLLARHELWSLSRWKGRV